MFSVIRKCFGLRQQYITRRHVALFVGTVVAPLCFVGDYLDEWFWIQERRKTVNEDVIFQPGSSEETQMHKLSTGDVVLIANPVMSFNPYRVLKTVLNKWIQRSNFDHCGVVVQDREGGVPVSH